MRKTLYQKYIRDLVNYNDENPDLNLIRIYLKSTFGIDDDEINECITDGYGDQCIDAVYIDQDAKTLYLIQSKFDKKSCEPITDLIENVDIKAFSTSIEHFIEEDNEDYFKNNLNIKEKYILYNTLADDYAATKGKEYNKEYLFLISRDCSEKEIPLNKKTIKIVDIEDIYNKYDNMIKEDNYPNLKFKILKDLEYSTDEYSTRLCIVSIKDFLEGIKDIDYNDLIFDNVRFAYRKSSVNLNIKKTLESDKIKNFYLYNNGITMLCDEMTVRNNSINATNASIINGGQTTYEILNSVINKDFDGQFLLRLNKRMPENNVNNEISINLNNQNKIKPLFLYSNNPVVQDFKESVECTTDYFLEIKENQFFKDNPKGKLRKNLISLEDIIRIFIVSSKHELSYQAKNNKQGLLENDKLIEDIINNNFTLEKFNDVYPVWHKITQYIVEHRCKRKKIDEIKCEEEKRRLGYNFVNTSNYLILYTIYYHNIKNIDDTKINKIIDELYKIEELDNSNGNAISKNTQSLIVFEKVKNLSLNQKLR